MATKIGDAVPKCSSYDVQKEDKEIDNGCATEVQQARECCDTGYSTNSEAKENACCSEREIEAELKALGLKDDEKAEKSPDENKFVFHYDPKTAFNAAEENKENEEESDADEEEEESPCTVQPVCPLPELIKVVTGEEDEEVLFQERCKLYRFDRESREVQERGLGEMKVLKNPKSGRMRCVMRREQILNLCANFPIVAQMEIKAKAGTDETALFFCQDFSECDDGEGQTFYTRFRTGSTRERFINLFREGVAAFQ
ncbi:unnamed protein product, partial [Mesorhabditis spiculigera]